MRISYRVAHPSMLLLIQGQRWPGNMIFVLGQSEVALNFHVYCRSIVITSSHCIVGFCNQPIA